MNDVIGALTASPVLALVGLAVMLIIVFAPAALSLAGLTGAQIIELLKATMAFVVEVIREFRRTNNDAEK